MLSCGPSVSAENSFLIDEKTYQISNGCTYEIAVIKEIFRNYLRINKLLKKDGKLAEMIAEQVKKLPDLRILSDGTLAEWSHDYPAADTASSHQPPHIAVSFCADYTGRNSGTGTGSREND